ncbi:polycystic kidney disease protein 1-like 1 [Elysia marginata]|uniref:Polycystic kidney disease protein 1-like 1 n=1 Tax=Elysia marginata TaxID=1093978 RepID=A0AAV4FI24_9GAST|nr:polycystic kidney disease protein 1-like 1 [Elysia marginata]
MAIFCVENDWLTVLELSSHDLLASVYFLPNRLCDLAFSRGFLRPGKHELRVKVFNDIGSSETSLTLSARPLLENVQLFVPPDTVHGVPTYIKVLVEGEAFLTISCDFGDGNTATFNTHSSSLHTSSRPSSKESHLLHVKELPVIRDGPSIYQANINHTYVKTGHYRLSMIVSNGLSQVRRSRRVVVEEAIGAVTLAINTPYVMSIDEELEVTAHVHSGQRLKFSWDFSDSNMPTVVESEGNVSRARHTFNIPKAYVVSVTVSNHIQRRGVTVSLPQPITVVTMVHNVILQHVTPIGYHGPRWTAPLVVDKMATDPVKFEALSHGSSVTFTFDFGDGTSSSVVGWYEFGNMMMAVADHVYTQEGFYTVRLTASNALNNVSIEKALAVHVPPSGVKILGSAACVETSQAVHLNATTDRGVNVTYSWKLGDQTELVNSGAEVSHKYRNVGNYTILATAVNSYGQATNNVTVKVVAKIQEVTVDVEETRVYLDRSIKYKAVITPASAAVGAKYRWSFGDNVYRPSTHLSEVTHAARRAGRHFVQVLASNCLGGVASKPVPMDVVAELTRLRIRVIQKGFTPKTVKLKAEYYTGTGLSFHWDFGDGTRREVNNSAHVRHTYKRVGEYTVTLTANNSISPTKVTKKIFVLTEQCNPPVVADQTQLEALDSEPIRLELKVDIDCVTSTHITYQWDIWHKNGRKLSSFPLLDGRKHKLYFRFPSLLLPAGTLEAGQYIVQLKVEMEGTEIPVYSVVQRDLTITRALPVSHIYGGVQRYVGQGGSVWLDGGQSGFSHSIRSALGYTWSCAPIEDASASCFNDDVSQPEMKSSLLNFPVSWLRPSFQEFVFKLKVFSVPISKNTNSDVDKDDKDVNSETVSRDSASSVSDQVITIRPQEELIDVFLECVQCTENMVNSHSSISLRALTPWWHVDRALAYTWQLDQFDGEDGEATQVWEIHKSCVEADGSSYLSLRAADNAENISLAADNATIGTGNVTAFNTSSTAADENWSNQITAESIREFGGTPKKDASSSKDIEHPITYVDVSEDLEPKARGQIRRGKSNNGAEKNTVRGGATGVGREGSIRGDDVAPDELPPVGRPDCDDVCVRRYQGPEASTPLHLLSRSHTPIAVLASETLTGLDQPSLVIKPGVLDQGRTYLVRVEVKAEGKHTALHEYS